MSGYRKIVIFIHGFAEGPGVFRGMTDTVKGAGVEYQMLILPGHGGTCKDFARTKGDKWQQCVKEAINLNEKRYDEIYLIGHSLGALLAITCSDYSDKIKGIMLLNAPLAVRVSPRAILINLTIGLGLPIKEGSPASAAVQSMSVGKGYPWEYIGWLPRLKDLFDYIHEANRKLPEVRTPMYAYHSDNDELIGESGYKRLKKLAPAHSKITQLHQSTHYGYAPTELSQINTDIENLIN